MTVHDVVDMLYGVLFTTGLLHLSWKYLVMWGISDLFLYLAIVKNFEPLLLLPIGFGILVVNFPLVPLMGHNDHGYPGLLQAFYHYDLEWESIPCVIFLGLGAMTLSWPATTGDGT